MSDLEKEKQEIIKKLKEVVAQGVDLQEKYLEMKKANPELWIEFFEGSNIEEKLKTWKEKLELL
jgi:hypothetical protein